MKKKYIVPTLLTIAALVSACSTMPANTTLLQQTRSDYAMAQGNPNVATYAALEMNQASEALDRANAAANHNDSTEQIDKLAYLAKQKIAVAQEVAKQKSAEADIARSNMQRERIRLEQRTNEANQAKLSAEQAQRAAQQAQNDATDAQRRAQMAQDDAAESQRKTRDAQARAAQLEAQLAELSAKNTERGMMITLGDVLFGTDMARLNSEGLRTAQKLAAILQQNPQRTVLVEGFTDSTGSPAHNQELSERRANAVRTALQEMGIGAERIATRGYGNAYPVASNNTAENRQLNRRVEIILSDANGSVKQR